MSAFWRFTSLEFHGSRSVEMQARGINHQTMAHSRKLAGAAGLVRSVGLTRSKGVTVARLFVSQP